MSKNYFLLGLVISFLFSTVAFAQDAYTEENINGVENNEEKPLVTTVQPEMAEQVPAPAEMPVWEENPENPEYSNLDYNGY